VKRLRTLVGYLSILVLIELAIIKYIQFLIRRRPPNNPSQCARRHSMTGTQKVVVCVGDSITRGEVSYNYVDMLQERLGSRFEVINAGVNSELSYEVLQRLEEVVACDPDVVTVLIGTNDAQASISAQGALWTKVYRRLPETPSIAWFEENLRAITRRLRRETRARIALISLPPIGEDLTSDLVETTSQFSAAIRRVAEDDDIGYLPLFERMVNTLAAHDTTRRVNHETWRWQNVKAILEEKILGAELDEIAERNGLLLHADLLHLNSKGAAMVVDLIDTFVRQADEIPPTLEATSLPMAKIA
jgi:lysophospholipase L1-like esterase